MSDFNFDTWVNLYRLDPVEFETQRNLLLEEAIKEYAVIDSEKANQILAHINGINLRLSRIKNPIERYNQMIVIFWKQFEVFQESLKGNVPTLKSLASPANVVHIKTPV
jgi:Protein of unknown function (DUF3135)